MRAEEKTFWRGVRGGKNPQASRGTYSSSMSSPLISHLKFVSSGYFCFALAIIVFMLFSNNAEVTLAAGKKFAAAPGKSFEFVTIDFRDRNDLRSVLRVFPDSDRLGRNDERKPFLK